MILRALAGGALIGVAASIALVVHGRVAGISGTLGRVLQQDGGARFRVPFLVAMIATGAIAAAVAPSTIGAPVRGVGVLAVAGVLVGVGTTLGNGCTSGHGVCGLARGSARSLVAVLTFMATAMLTVLVAGAHA
jgi:uncharacterized membrane protein YedE/YeeE